MGERERILLADDLPVTRQGIKLTFEVFGEEAGHEIVGEAGSVEGVARLLEDGLRPTLALIDANMPGKGDGERAAVLLRQKSPETKIVSFSTDRQTWGDVNWVKGEFTGRELVEQVNKV
jgi:DNA-binding NarL/FixJ family response regulator